MRALIVERGDSRGALAAARALAAAGWLVGIGSPDRRGLAVSSRATRAWDRVPRPEEDVDRFVDAVARAVQSRGYEIVFGAGDAEVLALSAAREVLGAAVPYAEHPAVVRAFDKVQLVEMARGVGFPAPDTRPASEDALAAVRVPTVVKARLHWAPGISSGRVDTAIVEEPGAAVRAAGEVRSTGREPFLQDFVPGRLIALVTVTDRACRPLVWIQQRSERLWPSRRAGISARARSIPVDPALAGQAVELLAALRWFGLAELQLVEPDDGPPLLLELNGRFYGSMALALAAGVNLPDAWARLGTGRPAPALSSPRAGVRYQWLEGDLRAAWAEPRGGRLHDVLGCLAYAPGAAHSIWRASDPKPALRLTADLTRRAVRRLWSKAGPVR